MLVGLVGAAVLVVPALPARAATGTVGFTAAATGALEDEGLLASTIDISRDNTVDEITVDYTITAVTGIFDADFALNSIMTETGTVTLGVGIATVQLAVNVTDDLAGEGIAGTETFEIVLSNPQNITSPGPLDEYSLGTSTHTLTITDDGDAGTVEFTSPSSLVGETDLDSDHGVSLTRVGGTEGVASATVTSMGVTATSPADFIAVSEGVNFAHGDAATKTVNVTIVGDNEPNEGSEELSLSLSGLNAGMGTHGVTITDDDQSGLVRFANTFPVTSEPALTFDMIFERIGGDDGTVSVNYSTQDFTAGAVSDYLAASGTLDFTQGITSQTVTITIVDDLVDENDEIFQVNMTGDTTGQTFAWITITDDDLPLTANFDSYTTPEDTPLIAAVSVLANDTGPGGVDLDVASYGPPTQGILSFGDGSPEAIALDLENGLFTYTPPENFEGEAFFSYSVTDGMSIASGTIRVTVTDNNTAPIGVDDSFANVMRTEPTVLDVLANDVDQDGDELTILTTTVTTALGNSVDCTGGVTCTFTPATGFVGSDSFSYSIEDPLGEPSGANVSVLVGMPRGCDIVATPGVPLIGTAADEVLCGTDADDHIDGGGGEDVILGMGGNDTLVGGEAQDRLVGGAGNDTLIPGPGDNDDTLGGPGIDTVRYTANDASADMVVLSETSISIEASDGNPSDGDLHETVELIILDLLGGNDTVTIQPGDNAAMDVRGGSGTDRLNYDTNGLTGVADSGSVIIASGKQPVTHSSFEIRVTDSFVILGDANSQNWVFNSSQAAGLIIDPFENSDSVQIGLGSLLGPVTVTDSGVSGTDTLTVLGSTQAESIAIRPVSVRSGDETINYSGVERLNVLGGGGDDTFTLDVDAGFAPAAFSLDVVVNGGGGTDTLRLTSESPCQLVDDTVFVDGIASFGVIAVEVLITTCAGVTATQSFASGYWLVDATGRISTFGLDHFGDHTTLGGVGAPVSGLGDRPDKLGYWTVQANGDVTAFGSAEDFGDLPGIAIVPAFPIVGMASTTSGAGYYLLGLDGGVFTFGDAAFFGSTGNIALDQPVVAMATNPAGDGYWFVASDGGMFTYGPETAFLGSVPQIIPYALLEADIVGMAATATGNGYWLVAEDGGVFAFGDAQFFGSVPGVLPVGVSLDAPIVGIVATPSGNGYWIVGGDGGVFTFGDAVFLGSLGGIGAESVVALAG